MYSIYNFDFDFFFGTFNIKINSPNTYTLHILSLFNFVARLLNIYLTCLCIFDKVQNIVNNFFQFIILWFFQGSLVKDFFTSLCCEPCAVCQMNRELDNIGMWFWISSTVIFHLSYLHSCTFLSILFYQCSYDMCLLMGNDVLLSLISRTCNISDPRYCNCKISVHIFCA